MSPCPTLPGETLTSAGLIERRVISVPVHRLFPATVPRGIPRLDPEPWALDPEDLDGDTETDLVIVCRGSSSGGSEGEVRIGVNQGGAFLVSDPIQVGQLPASVAVSDFDNNAFADIVVTNQNDDTISLILNDGAGVFRPTVDLPVGGAPRSITRINLETLCLCQSFCGWNIASADPYCRYAGTLRPV